jgi:hypothetical protein
LESLLSLENKGKTIIDDVKKLKRNFLQMDKNMRSVTKKIEIIESGGDARGESSLKSFRQHKFFLQKRNERYVVELNFSVIKVNNSEGSFQRLKTHRNESSELLRIFSPENKEETDESFPSARRILSPGRRHTRNKTNVALLNTSKTRNFTHQVVFTNLNINSPTPKNPMSFL